MMEKLVKLGLSLLLLFTILFTFTAGCGLVGEEVENGVEEVEEED